MTRNFSTAFLSFGVLAALAGATFGCVSDRPSRNGVFNENQYVRKEFLVRPVAGPDGKPKPDTGWMLASTITEVSSPNLLGSMGVYPGAYNSDFIRFRVTQDKLQMLSMMELSANPPVGRTENVVNAWPATNVDLKYRVNLDGENTNFYEENQELDWQARQWVKLNFAKNDMSDFAPMGPFFEQTIMRCVDGGNVTATLVPDSFWVDEKNDYIQWSVSITLPLKFDNPVCTTAYGRAGALLGRTTETLNLMYSLTRAKPLPAADDPDGYKPLELDEKDPIRHKYGTFDYITIARESSAVDDPATDPDGLKHSGQLAARQLVMRFHPNKPIVYYFDRGFPEVYKQTFRGPGGVAESTNKIFVDAGAKARLEFRDWDYDKDQPGYDPKHPRTFGDVRYNFLRYMTDQDNQVGFIGVANFITDPRTGETLKSTSILNESNLKDGYAQHIDAYLKGVGASEGLDSTDPWATETCKAGDPPKPIISGAVKTGHNTSTLFTKMQQYMLKPTSTYGALGPQDFIEQKDEDFLKAWYAWLPYQVYDNPNTNAFVIPEGGGGVFGPGALWAMREKEVELEKVNAKIDQGLDPFDGIEGPGGFLKATDFILHFRDLIKNHTDLRNAEITLNKFQDNADDISILNVMQKDARHCVQGKDGAWHYESKNEWVNNLVTSTWKLTLWHEFGHDLGLAHNFMGSVDARNYSKGPDGKITMYSSSIMEYNQPVDRVFWVPQWGNYDKAAIAFIYGNNGKTQKPPADMQVTSISGQVSAEAPWKDPYGFNPIGKTENLYLYCTNRHVTFSPMCRTFDLGTTPSEIIANDVDRYEWEYKFRNSRLYRKIWNNYAYGTGVLNTIYETKRYLTQWGEIGGLTEFFRRTGLRPPTGIPIDTYNAQLIAKFNDQFSRANTLSAAFHQALINQSSGERPFATRFDTFYGDTLQQGIILDKVYAVQSWSGLSPVDNINPSGRRGSYLAPYAIQATGAYSNVAESAIEAMIGGGYDAYPWLAQSTVAAFAHDTHSINFNGRFEIREWMGGQAFYRLSDFLDYFKAIAITANFNGVDPLTKAPVVCKNGFDATAPPGTGCTYDVRNFSNVANQVTTPDGRNWIWIYLKDRNAWVASQKERNPTSYQYFLSYTLNFSNGVEDNGDYFRLRTVKYYIDAFVTYR